MRKINQIVVHCSDTPEGAGFNIDDIRRWHIEERGWLDVGYHFVILLDGTIQVGRPVERIGAHVKNHNARSIGICYIGGGGGEDTRTDEQRFSLTVLIATLKRTYKKAEVLGHRNFSIDKNKDGKITKDEWMKKCPSFDAKTEYKNL